MTDLELDQIHRLLSVPAERQPGNVSRRRFLQGALAAGTLASSPVWFDRLAAAATPVGATEGILVVIHLGGGLDGLNAVVPIGDSSYRTLRGSLAITSPLPLSTTFGFHPALAGLKASTRSRSGTPPLPFFPASDFNGSANCALAVGAKTLRPKSKRHDRSRT